MSPRRHATRIAVTVLLAAGVGAVAASGAAAAAAPLPLPSLPAPSPGTDPVTTVRDTVTGLLGAVSTPTPTPAPSPHHPGAAAAAPPNSADRSSSTAASPTAASSAAKPSAAKPSDSSSPAQPTSAQRPRAASSSTGVHASTPAASICLIPTGGASPAFEVGLDVVGQDLSSPLVKQFPQALAPCPAGAVRADGDPVAAVDAGVYGLIGACMRVTRQGVPLQTSLVVLDQDLILDLVEAGAPVEQLVVPCPAGAASAPGQGGGSATPTSQDSAAGSSGAGETGALPDLLAFTGTEPGPVVFAAVVLMCSGAVLVRKARLLAAAARG